MPIAIPHLRAPGEESRTAMGDCEQNELAQWPSNSMGETLVGSIAVCEVHYDERAHLDRQRLSSQLTDSFRDKAAPQLSDESACPLVMKPRSIRSTLPTRRPFGSRYNAESSSTWHNGPLIFVCCNSDEGTRLRDNLAAILRASFFSNPTWAKRCTGSPTVSWRAGSGMRTRPVTRVNNEKRNADQRPPTGGEPDCHR